MNHKKIDCNVCNHIKITKYFGVNLIIVVEINFWLVLVLNKERNKVICNNFLTTLKYVR